MNSQLHRFRRVLGFSSDDLRLGILEIPWPHWQSVGIGLRDDSLSRRNNKNSPYFFICRILDLAPILIVMAEIQKRIRLNTLSMSVLMITIAVGVMTAMWMYADAAV